MYGGKDTRKVNNKPLFGAKSIAGQIVTIRYGNGCGSAVSSVYDKLFYYVTKLLGRGSGYML